MNHVFSAAIVAAGVGALSASPASAQDTPCKAALCVLVIDWGSGKSAADYPYDRRYGSADDFAARFRSVMTANGFRLSDTPVEGALVMNLRPQMRPRSMCDAMAGLNTDMSCTAMSALAVNFVAPQGSKGPGAIRITNRCAAGDVYMPHKEFAQYAGDFIQWQLEGQAAKKERPVGNC
ncbi:MAG: hypothetical protein FJ202_06235 [Gemmatimonadetes bacterium]|nr:hypothetical protein [Gemmatimonadota bacterium]